LGESIDPNRDRVPLIVVSGLPRSGTSMMMRMLGAGGVELLADGARPADDGNPHGYFELSRVKRLRVDAGWLRDVPGKAVKIVSPLLRWVPASLPVDLILMRRDLGEILASQHALLARRAAPAPARGRPLPSSDDELAALFVKHQLELRAWIAARREVRVVEVEHGDAIRDPAGAAARVRAFLGLALDRDAMVRAVDPRLYRSRHLAAPDLPLGPALPS
jgi:hypothetical protein